MTKRGWVDKDWILATKTTRYDGDGGSLLKLSVDGSVSETTLWSDTSIKNVFHASISKDQSKVVFQYQTGTVTNLYLYNMSSTTKILLVENGTFATWSPDDQYVIFLRESNLLVVDLNGNEQQITSDGVYRGVTTWRK